MVNNFKFLHIDEQIFDYGMLYKASVEIFVVNWLWKLYWLVFGSGNGITFEI